MKTLGFLVECQGRTLFIREREEILWAINDENYTVTELVGKSKDPVTDDTVERLEILEEIYELEEKEIASLKHKLEEFVELAEAIVEIAVPTENIIENKAKILLIGESCKKLLAPKD